MKAEDNILAASMEAAPTVSNPPENGGRVSPVPPPLYAAGRGRKRPPAGESGEAGSQYRKEKGISRILLFGRMRELALYRAEVLQTRGFSVVLPETKAEAIEAIETGELDAVVLSYTLSSDTVEELAEILRQQSPGCPLITISDTGKVDPRLHPDQTVLANRGPAALIKALHQVLRRQ